MPFEKGNQHAAKAKLFDAALRRAIAQDSGVKVRKAADALLDAAASGEQWAIGMLADRLDGKPGQSVEVTHNRSLKEMSLDELRARVADLLAGADAGGDRSQAGGQGLTH